MKKLTASIFTVLLATIGTANADIASQAYVDKQTGTLTSLETTAKNNLVAAINELNTKAGSTSVADQIAAAVNPVKAKADAALPSATAESDYLKKADAMTTYQTLGNLTTELTATSTDAQYPSAKAVYDATKDLATADNVYTKTAADGKFADKATTLSGYGITDAYTKTEVDTELDKKADSATTLAGYGITDAYTKTETDGAIDTAINELDLDNTYATKAQGDKADSAVQSVTKSGTGNILTDITTTDNAVTVTVSGTAIPQPSGQCTDCVLHYNGTAYSWEEITR